MFNVCCMIIIIFYFMGKKNYIIFSIKRKILLCFDKLFLGCSWEMILKWIEDIIFIVVLFLSGCFSLSFRRGFWDGDSCVGS